MLCNAICRNRIADKNVILRAENQNMGFRYVEEDVYLKPFASYIESLHQKYEQVLSRLTGGSGDLASFANGHLYFGAHLEGEEIVFREWAPAATAIYLLCEANTWQKHKDFRFHSKAHGQWELRVHRSILPHGSLYKLFMEWDGGYGERIPAWARRVVQDPETKIFSAQIWFPEPYQWKHPVPPRQEVPLIYEAHVGMSSEEETIATWNYFRENVLPRIYNLGYNTIQLMAVQEHPYYGSFGYHVSSFFAASSRFGTPEELKQLIDEAHGLGIRVLMDLVHSHAVKNEVEGLSRYDGTYYQFFHDGFRGNHIAWDSRCFDYGKNEVIHFLLSNCKYWLEEFHFDGFRFDGVTSMCYKDHGLGSAFMRYDDFFQDNLDEDAIVYLKLANKLIHQLRPDAITIAEDVSGFPGMAHPVEDGGVGFDYRLAMGVPDFWIKTVSTIPDEQWHMGHMFFSLTNKRVEEKVISYCESHDQALVGDKTLSFHLMDSAMYWFMNKDSQNLIIDRGIALHKMIRLVTIGTAQGGYLNFMGNEFGHPEWIDFPRAGNNWSFFYARRQWSLVDNPALRYQYLNNFDRAMIHFVKEHQLLVKPVKLLYEHNEAQVLAFERNGCVFVFNFNPVMSFTDFGIPCAEGEYHIVLCTDDAEFGGFQRVDTNILYFSKIYEKDTPEVKLYLPSRVGIILKRKNI